MLAALYVRSLCALSMWASGQSLHGRQAFGYFELVLPVSVVTPNVCASAGPLLVALVAITSNGSSGSSGTNGEATTVSAVHQPRTTTTTKKLHNFITTANQQMYRHCDAETV